MNDFLKKPLVKVLMLKGEKGETGDVSKETLDNSINDLTDLISNNRSRIDDAQNRIKTTNSRIDNLIVSSGSESSAEVIDARTGYDGTAYDTLGTAIRSQVNNLNDYCNSVKVDVSSGTKQVMYYDGRIEDYEGARLIRPISIKKGQYVYVKVRLYSSIQSGLFVCDSTGKFIKSLLNGNSSTHDYVEKSFTANSDMYIGICGFYDDTYKITIRINNKNIGIENVGEVLSDDFGLESIATEYEPKILYYGVKDGFYTEDNSNAYLSKPILVPKGYTIYAKLNMYNSIQVAMSTCTKEGECINVVGVGENKSRMYSYYATEDTYVKIGSLEQISVLYLQKNINIYHVGSDKEFTSFTDCIKSLNGNESEKYIYVDAGEYDLFKELGGSTYAKSIKSGTDWFDCNVLIPSNTHIVGIGNVIFNFNPTREEIGEVANILLSPINPTGNFSMENITVIAENCRYCVHDDVSLKPIYGNSLHEYRNVKLKKTNNGFGYDQAFGGGIGNNQRIIIKDCVISANVNACSFHDNSENPKGTILIENSAIYGGSYRSLSFTNVFENSTEGHIDVKVINTYTDKNIVIGSETGTNVINNYDLTVIRSGNITKDTLVSERYTPLVLN